MTFSRNKILIILIVFSILFARLWKVESLFNFNFSEEMQAHMAWEQVKNFHPIWIGVSAANINYYLGPGFTYLNALLFKISNGNPAFMAWFSALFGLVTIASIYFIVSNLFSKRVAIFTIIIYGFSTLINLHDRRFWNPTPIPFITIWMIFSLTKAKKNPKWLVLTAVLIGAAFHTHLTLLLFIIPTLYIVYLSLKKNSLKTNIKVGILAFIVYLIVTSPLIVFDIVHNFDNLMMPLRIISGTQKADLNQVSIANIQGHIKELSSAFGRLWFIKLHTNPHDEIVLESHLVKTYGNPILSLLTYGALLFFIVKNRKQGFEIFVIYALAIITAFIIYPSYNPEYYLMSLLTILTIAIGFTLDKLSLNFSVPLVILFVIFNIYSVVTLSDKYGLTVRAELVKKTMQKIGDKSFELQTFGEFEKPQYSYAGWRYLFKHYGKTPAQSNVDSVLGWIYPDEISNKTPELKVIVSDTIEPTLDARPQNIVKNGVYSAYIYKN